MPGIVFFGTKNLKTLEDFYTTRLDCNVWKDQGSCVIFRKEDFYFAFCEKQKNPETCGIITFVFENKAEVDEIYEKVEDIAENKPTSRRPEFNIYQFFAKDPEGRTLEFQCFLD